MSDINAETHIEQRVQSLEARMAALEHPVNALQRLITIPAPGELGYEDALAKELPYWEQQDADERACLCAWKNATYMALRRMSWDLPATWTSVDGGAGRKL